MDKDTYHREGYLYQNRYKYYPALGGTHQEDAAKILIDKNTWPVA